MFFYKNDIPIDIQKKQKNTVSKYKTIGETLSSLEYFFIQVGIPFVPRIRNSFKEKKETVIRKTAEESLKINLVTISTADLISYYENLIKSKNALKIQDELYINKLSIIERFCFFVFLFIVISITTFYNYQNTLNSIALLIIRISYIVSIIISLLLSSDYYRKLTFQNLIKKEINRRHGIDKTTKTPLTPVNI